MGGLSYSAVLHRLYGVKVKLSYKSEGLERLFLQLIKEKLTNLDKFPPTLTSSPPHPHLSPLALYKEGKGGGGGDYVFKLSRCGVCGVLAQLNLKM